MEKKFSSNKREFPWPVGHKPTREEIEKYFEEKFGISVSFHWKDVGGGKKRGVLTPIKKSLNDLEKALGNGQPVNNKIGERQKKEGNVTNEEMYFESENQSQLITLQNKTVSSQIQEITDKETEQIKTKISPNSDKKDQKIEKETNQQDFPQKINNKKDKNIYYGVGVTTLVLLLTSIVVVGIKKKR